jgi:hypothetical protein
LGFVERGGIGDTLTALLGWEGINQDMSRTDKPCIHGCRGLDGHQLVHQLAIEASPKCGKRLGTDKGGLSAVGLDFTDATRIHDGTISAESVTNRLVQTAQLVFEPFQGQ